MAGLVMPWMLSQHLSAILGAIRLCLSSRYLARRREVQLTQFARAMVTKIVVAITWLPVGIGQIVQENKVVTDSVGEQDTEDSDR